MSYPGVNPADTATMNPVAQQEVSAGVQEAVAAHNTEMNAALAGTNPVQSQGDYAPSAWSNRPKELTFEIETPSGQKCLAKHLSVMQLISSGLLEEIDFFSKKLFPTEANPSGNAEDADDAGLFKTLKDKVKRKRFFDLLDGLLAVSIVKPTVRRIPPDIDVDDYEDWNGPALPPMEVWANMIDFGDKMHIFNELNKPMSEVNSFRITPEGEGEGVAARTASEVSGSQAV